MRDRSGTATSLLARAHASTSSPSRPRSPYSKTISLGMSSHRAIQAVRAEWADEEVVFNVASNGKQSSSLLALSAHAAHHPDIVYTGAQALMTTTVDAVSRLRLRRDRVAYRPMASRVVPGPLFAGATSLFTPCSRSVATAAHVAPEPYTRSASTSIGWSPTDRGPAFVEEQVWGLRHPPGQCEVRGTPRPSHSICQTPTRRRTA